MPKKAPTPCRSPYCPALVSDSRLQGFCVDHQHIVEERRAKYQSTSRTRRADNTEQRTLDAFYGTSAWRSCRNAYMAKSPLCEHCAEEGVLQAADVVDHIHERKDGGANYDHNNLQSLCHACHNRKTVNERRRRNV